MPPPPAAAASWLASIRAEPAAFNRLVARDADHRPARHCSPRAGCVRINRTTFELEPWLAETWESSADGRTHTLHLRQGVTWSDGTPFTAADVLFTLQAVFDRRRKASWPSVCCVAGKPIAAAAPERSHGRPDVSRSVRRRACGCSTACRCCRSHKLAGGARRRHLPRRLDVEHAAGRARRHRAVRLREYQSGQRVVLDRNPRYWRKAAERRCAAVSRSPGARDRPRPERRAAAAAGGRHRHDAERAAHRRLRAGASRRAGSRHAAH